VKSDQKIIEEFKKRKGISERGLRQQLDNSVKCDAFYDGDMMEYTSDVLIERNRIRGVQFNKVQPYINAVSGFMIQTRREVKYYPLIQDPAQRNDYARQANSLKDYVRRNTRAEQVESQGDTQLIIKGYAATETAMTYGMGYSTTDPNGEIIMDDITNDVRWDPMARKKNILDSRWVYYRRSFPWDDAKVLFDDKDEEDYDEGCYIDNETGYQYDPTLGQPYDRSRLMPDVEWDSKTNKTVWVYFYQWSETEKFYRAKNPVYALTNPLAIQAAMLKMDEIEALAEQEDSMFRFEATAEDLVFDEETKKRLEEAFEDLIECFPYNRKVFYTAVLSKNKVFTSYRSACQQGFSVKFKTGIWNNTRKIWVGMVNAMMEPTKYYNKGLTELMFLIAKNSKGGWFIEDDATDDVRSFENNIARTNAVIKLNAGGLAKIKEKSTPFSPQGYDQVIAMADNAVSDSSGVDKNFIMQQSGSGNMTAQLHRQLVKQVTSTLAPYFDAREAYQEEQARLLLDFLAIYAENNVGGTIRILGDKGSEEFMQISQDPFAAEYDVKIEEAPQSDEEKTEQAQILTTMGDKLLAIQDPTGKQFYLKAIKYMPLDDEDKRELSDVLVPQQDPVIEQLKQQIAALTSEQAKLQAANIQATTKYTLAKATEAQANTQYKAAQTAETATDIDQKTLENAIISSTPDVKASVSI